MAILPFLESIQLICMVVFFSLVGNRGVEVGKRPLCRTQPTGCIRSRVAGCGVCWTVLVVMVSRVGLFIGRPSKAGSRSNQRMSDPLILELAGADLRIGTLDVGRPWPRRSGDPAPDRARRRLGPLGCRVHALGSTPGPDWYRCLTDGHRPCSLRFLVGDGGPLTPRAPQHG